MIGKRECVGRYDLKSQKDKLLSDFPRMLTKPIQITGNHAAHQNLKSRIQTACHPHLKESTLRLTKPLFTPCRQRTLLGE